MQRIPGIDISAWQDLNSTPQRIDWPKAKAQGIKFAFIRACNGFVPDEDFDYNWEEAKRVGLLRGAYQFYDYRKSPTEQAKFFASLMTDPGELPPVIDLEYYDPWGAIKRNNILSNLQAYINTMQSAGFPRVTFYSNPAMILYTLAPIPSFLTALPLWIAHYGVDAPSTSAVAPWGKWTFWQYTPLGDGLAYGMESKGLDMDWFNGSEEELHDFAGVSIPEVPEYSDVEKLKKLWEWYEETH